MTTITIDQVQRLMMTANKTRTPDGERTRVEDLNLGESLTQPDVGAKPKGLGGRLRHAFRNLNLTLAGMYTGLSCYGTPHSHHSYRSGDKNPEEEGASSKEKPDRSPV